MTNGRAALLVVLLLQVPASSQEGRKPQDILQLKDGGLVVGDVIQLSDDTVWIWAKGNDSRRIPIKDLMPYSVYRLKVARVDRSIPSSRFELGKYCYESKLYPTALWEFQGAAERYSELDDAGRKARAPVREEEARVLLGYVKTLLSKAEYRMASDLVRSLAKGYGDTTPYTEAEKLEAAELTKSRLAEEPLRKIEEKIQEAKTIKIKFTSETTSIVNGRESRTTNSGVLLAQQGNKANLSGLTVRSEGIVQNKNEYSFVSDGTQIEEWYRYGRERTTSVTPGNFDTQIRTMLVRLGPALVFEHLDRKSTQRRAAAQRFVASDFEDLPREGTRRGISYKLEGMGGEVVRVSLWYEAGTYELIRRIAKTISSDGIELSTTSETYEEFVFNRNMPVDSFKLPER